MSLQDSSPAWYNNDDEDQDDYDEDKDGSNDEDKDEDDEENDKTDQISFQISVHRPDRAIILFDKLVSLI